MKKRFKYAWRLLFGGEPFLVVFAKPEKKYVAFHGMNPEQLDDIANLMDVYNIETEIEKILHE